MALEIRETFVNETKGYRFGDSEWYEPYTQDRGELYRSLRKEYGRCTSKMYRDTKDGKTKVVGWVFSKRMEYEDARSDWPKDKRFYIREVWVEVRDLEQERYEQGAKRQQVDIG